MFSKENRLTRPAFEKHFKTGKRFHAEALTAIYSPSPHIHISVVVGKKVAKKAHERNIIRRRVYGASYRYLKKEEISGTYIFIAKPGLIKLTRKDQNKSVQKLLNRITLSQ